MALRLLVLTADLDPPPSVLLCTRRITVGRAADSHVRLPDPSVSLEHATLTQRGESYLLMDEGSRYGTGVGSGDAIVWLPPHSPRILQDGEHLWFGQIEVKVEFVASARGQRSGQEELAASLVAAGLRAAGLDPNPDLIESTLQELTDLEEELLPLPPDEEEAPPPARGVAALAHEDRYAPWKTDLFIALIALLILAGCVLFLSQLGAFS